MKKKSKFYKVLIFIISIIALSIIATTATIFFKNNNKTVIKTRIFKPESIKSKTKSENNNSFFPKKLNLNQTKIYSLIRIKNGISFFKKELLSLILNQVIDKGSFINGKLHYWYKFIDNNKLFNIAFRWQSSSGHIQEKTYSIKIID